jgi:hypothetical protein
MQNPWDQANGPEKVKTKEITRDNLKQKLQATVFNTSYSLTIFGGQVMKLRISAYGCLRRDIGQSELVVCRL